MSTHPSPVSAAPAADVAVGGSTDVPAFPDERGLCARAPRRARGRGLARLASRLGRNGRSTLALALGPTLALALGPALALCLVIAPGCEPAAPARVAPVVWPTGTVLALDEAPITAEEVDEVASRIAVIEPGYELPHLRRLALTNVVLPRAAARALSGPRRERARAQAEAYRELLASGAATPVPYLDFRLDERTGGYADVGMECFDYALTAPIGVWSAVTESVGVFEIYRVEERTVANTPKKTSVRVTACYVPYLDENNWYEQIEKKLDRSRLVYVDESWRDVVPELWKHRLRGESP